MKPPIIIVDREGVDLSIHDSLEEAQNQLEAIDVRNREYVAYDAAGRLLTIDIVTEKTRTLSGLVPADFASVRISDGEAAPTHHVELRKALIAFLIASGSLPEALEHLTPSALIERAKGVG